MEEFAITLAAYTNMDSESKEIGNQEYMVLFRIHAKRNSIPLDVMIEKATPKKPKHIKVITDFNGRYYTRSGNCPSCGEEGLNKSSNYCHKCEQRLDWEVNEHEK